MHLEKMASRLHTRRGGGGSHEVLGKKALTSSREDNVATGTLRASTLERV